jgi:hypothetical protein
VKYYTRQEKIDRKKALAYFASSFVKIIDIREYIDCSVAQPACLVLIE